MTKEKTKYLRRKDWTQRADGGEIYIKTSKVDPFGRGNAFKYARVPGRINPVYWMEAYSEHHKRWTTDRKNHCFCWRMVRR